MTLVDGESLPRLSNDQLGRVSGASTPRYDRRTATPGVVHLGLGAFARAHVARYCDDLLALGEPAAITGVSLRSGSSTTPLAKQDGLYTLIETDGSEAELRVIGSVTRLANGSTEAIAAIASPGTTAVTMTVTEKGYLLAPGGGILHDSPEVAHDVAAPARPMTAPGVLVAALRRRREQGLGGLVIVSCDNLAKNGVVTAAVVCDLAQATDPDLADWIVANVDFPSSVVDRIVPAATVEDRGMVAERTGLRDEAPVRAERHCSWVIERADRLPPWDRVGALVVDDSTPWELRKLRMVNAPHSTLAYLGALAGYKTIDQAVGDPSLAAFTRELLTEELAATLEPTPPDPHESTLVSDTTGRRIFGGVPSSPTTAPPAEKLADETLARFANPALGHRCQQVAADGSQKLPQRIVSPLAQRLSCGLPVDRLTGVIAAWIAWVQHCSRGKAKLVDPYSGVLLGAADSVRGSNAVKVAEKFLAIGEIFPGSVAESPQVRSGVADALALIADLGPARAAERLTNASGRPS